MGRSFRDNPDKYRDRYHHKKKHHKHRVQDETVTDDRFLKKIANSPYPLELIDPENQ